MTDLPLVTIGIASYNNARFIVETLESVRAQTYPHIELLVYDDCSTDESVEVIQTWIAKQQRFSSVLFFPSPRNGGIVQAANWVLQHSTGEFYQLLGSDDILDSNKIEVEINAFRSQGKDCAVVFGDARLIKGDGSLRHGYFIQMCHHFVDVPSGLIFPDLLERNFIPAPAVLVRKSAAVEVGGYDPQIAYEDWDFWLRLSKQYSFFFYNQVLVSYRMHHANMTSRLHFAKENLKIFVKHVHESPVAYSKLIHWCLVLYQQGRITRDDASIVFHARPSGITRMLFYLVKFRVPYSVGRMLLKQVLPQAYFQGLRR